MHLSPIFPLHWSLWKTGKGEQTSPSNVLFDNLAERLDYNGDKPLLRVFQGLETNFSPLGAPTKYDNLESGLNSVDVRAIAVCLERLMRSARPRQCGVAVLKTFKYELR